MCTRSSHTCGKGTFVCAECHLMKWNRDTEFCEGCSRLPTSKTRIGRYNENTPSSGRLTNPFRFHFNNTGSIKGEKLTQ